MNHSITLQTVRDLSEHRITRDPAWPEINERLRGTQVDRAEAMIQRAMPAADGDAGLNIRLTPQLDADLRARGYLRACEWTVIEARSRMVSAQSVRAYVNQGKLDYPKDRVRLNDKVLYVRP